MTRQSNLVSVNRCNTAPWANHSHQPPDSYIQLHDSYWLVVVVKPSHGNSPALTLQTHTADKAFKSTCSDDVVMLHGWSKYSQLCYKTDGSLPSYVTELMEVFPVMLQDWWKSSQLCYRTAWSLLSYATGLLEVFPVMLQNWWKSSQLCYRTDESPPSYATGLLEVFSVMQQDCLKSSQLCYKTDGSLPSHATGPMEVFPVMLQDWWKYSQLCCETDGSLRSYATGGTEAWQLITSLLSYSMKETTRNLLVCTDNTVLW